MDIFLNSTALVTLGEIGDKTQLLALLLVARYLRPWPIIAGIFVATLANHALAVMAGHYLGTLGQSLWAQSLIALSFIAIGLWVLKPDSLNNPPTDFKHGAFTATTLAFFLAEMGDKTQLVTIALGAEYEAWMPVLLGTTLGMMLANLPAMFLGYKMLERIPMHLMRYMASALFIGTGIWALLRVFGYA